MYPTERAERLTFSEFYREVFLAEHRHPTNVGLHVAGTLASAALVPLAVLATPWLILLYPIVHAAPGLIGHRLFERSAAVGDIRVTRTDFSPLWFVAANHRLTWEVLAAALWRRARPTA
jgi:hypothetical protein